MSTKDWKNNELNGLLNERWGFSMDLNKLNEGSCGSHKRDDGEKLEEEEKCPKCEGKGCPDCPTKNEEKMEEEKKDSDGDGLTDKQEKLPPGLQKAIAKKKGLDLKEEEESKDFGPKTDMSKLSDEEEEKFLNNITIEKLRAALNKKEKDEKEA